MDLHRDSEEDSIKIIDTPIRGLYPREKRYNLLGRKYSFCEILLSFLVIISLTVIIGLSFAVSAADKKYEKLESKELKDDFCTTEHCKWEARFLMDNMNLTANPCDDFYEYVCGNFPKVFPRADNSLDLTIFQMLADKNTQRLVTLLNQQSRGSDKKTAQWKLKTFFQACRTALNSKSDSAKSLVDRINAPLSSEGGLGGWIGLGNFSNFDGNKFTNSDWVDLLAKAHGTYASRPFFDLTVMENVLSVDEGLSKEKYVMGISWRNVGIFNYQFFINDSSNLILEQSYRNFVYRVIDQLWKDIGIDNQSKSQINKTIDTIISVEKRFTDLLRKSAVTFNIKLQNVSSLPKGKNDTDVWKLILNSMFGAVSDNDVVKTDTVEFVQSLTDFLFELTPEEQNAYGVWKIVETFTQDFGNQYIDYYRAWLKVKQSGSEDFEQIFDWCFEISIKYLGDIIDAEFVENYFTEDDLSKAETIANSIKLEFAQQVNGYSWFTESEKLIGRTKVKSTRNNFGYPKGFIDNRDKLNEFFTGLSVSASDHFQNLLNVYKFQKDHDAELLQNPINIIEWPFNAFKTTYQYKVDTGELFLPAGVLQHPIYDSHIPMYLNFGSLGRIVGASIVGTLEEHSGAYVYPNYTSTGVGTWWNAESLANFTNGPKKCTTNLYEGKSYDPWLGVHTKVSANYFGDRHLNEMGGLKASYNAFLNYLNSAAETSHKFLDGLQVNSIDQLFFISYGQTYCFSRSTDLEEKLAKFPIKTGLKSLPEHLMLNTLMSQFPQFSQVFRCSSNSKLHYSCPKFCESY